MINESFLRPRLTGVRFDNHAVPLEFLKDLAVLEEMLVEVAKAEYYKNNPGRSRTPRGFTDGVELQLVNIEKGSSIPVIALVIASSGMLFPEIQEYLERARDSVIDAIGAAERDQTIAEHLPEKWFGYFEQLGRSLKEGEAIEFTSRKYSQPVRLTKETRRKLVLTSTKVKEYTEETTERGTIPEADQDKMTYTIQLADGRRINAPIDAQHLDTIIEVFNGYHSGKRLQVQGIGRFNRKGRLVRIETIQHVSILDPLDVGARLDEFRQLKDGWLEGYGKAPAKAGLDWLSKAFDDYFPDHLPFPYLYPTENGGIQAEWSLQGYELSCEFNLETKSGQWHMLDTDTGQDEITDLDLSGNEGWNRLVGWVIPKDGITV